MTVIQILCLVINSVFFLMVMTLLVLIERGIKKTAGSLKQIKSNINSTEELSRN